jgi:nicotinamide mononucleotide transporter
MSPSTLWNEFLQGLLSTGFLEYIAVFTGLASVWFSRSENILVYPVGLVNTIIYIYLSLKGHLLGEASVNVYYTIMSIYGWLVWHKKDVNNVKTISIGFSTKRDWIVQILFFLCFYIVLFFSLSYLKQAFAPEAIPWADAFASATAFTGMWLMARKKVESWYWWFLTNLASIPLYFVKHYSFTSVYYLILLVFAFFGWQEWKRKASLKDASKKNF